LIVLHLTISFSKLTVKVRVDTEISRLYRLLFLARNSAINLGVKTTVCPLVNNNCTNDWSLPLTVFTNKNNNKILESHLNEIKLEEKSAIPENDKLQYGKTRKGITYTASGHLSGWGQNGTFKYCPYQHMNMSRGIIVATSGRLYKSFQKTSGKEVNRSSQIIKCR